MCSITRTRFCLLQKLADTEIFTTFAEKKKDMEQSKTIQITLPLSDARFLRRLSGNMGWKIKFLPMKQKEERKVCMTKDEFRSKIEASSAQAESGNVIAMRPDETSEQFIDRLLCMQ